MKAYMVCRYKELRGGDIIGLHAIFVNRQDADREAQSMNEGAEPEMDPDLTFKVYETDVVE